MNVLEKENLTKYEVHLKIDNLNVEDMFDRNRTEVLLDIFRFVNKTQGKTWALIFPIHPVTRLIKLSLSFFLCLLSERGCGKTRLTCTWLSSHPLSSSVLVYLWSRAKVKGELFSLEKRKKIKIKRSLAIIVPNISTSYRSRLLCIRIFRCRKYFEFSFCNERRKI